VNIARKIRQFHGLIGNTNRAKSVLNHSKKEVNVVNVVNVGEHVLSYATSCPADNLCKRLGYTGKMEMMLAEAAWDRPILII
jgi:hypothetical protein